MAVPIADARGVAIAVVSVSAHSTLVPLEMLRGPYLARLQEAAAKISADLDAVGTATGRVRLR